VSVLRV